MKVWKKIAAMTMALGMVASLAACGNNSSDKQEGDDSGLKTVESGKLHMSTNAQFPPYEMTTDDGGFEGIDVEIAQAIAEKLGLELVVDDMGFDAALTAAQTGQSDMVMAGGPGHEERLGGQGFSES